MNFDAGLTNTMVDWYANIIIKKLSNVSNQNTLSMLIYQVAFCHYNNLCTNHVPLGTNLGKQARGSV